jgi:predicted dithiol-disulfide oxidoreductase (DUF899 family)
MAGTDVATQATGHECVRLCGGVVFHTYSAFARGLDGFWGAHQWLDRAPNGRNEPGYCCRRKDEYQHR